MITQILENTPLTVACNEIRSILSSNTLLQNLLGDTLRPTEPIIKSIPINYKSIPKEYQVAVYHTCNKQVIEEKNGVIITQAPIFIDCCKKVNQLDYDSIFDELEKFSHTVLGILYDQDTNKDLNGKGFEWQLYSQSIWKDTKNEQTKIADEKLYNYISQITLVIQYSTFYSTYF